MKAWESCDVDAVVGMLTEDACFSMPPLATWFGPRPEIETFLVGSPMSGMWRWKSVRVRSNGQVALAFYNWDDGEGAYVPFALNVLIFRGELISDVTAFIITTPPETDDREVIRNMPDRRPTRPAWRRRSGTSASPTGWTETSLRREDVGDGSAAEGGGAHGSMVSGALKSRSPAPRTTGWTTRRYSSIKPVSTSDRANRAPP